MCNPKYFILQCLIIFALSCLPILTGGGCSKKDDFQLPPDTGGEIVGGWQVTVESPSGSQSGEISIRYSHYGDAELDYTVFVEYAVTADMEFHSATRVGGGADLSRALPAGEDHEFVWDSGYDLGNGVYAVIVRLRVTEPTLGEIVMETDPFTVNNAGSDKPQWTILVYLDGDNDLEPYAFIDINGMELVGSTDEVNIVVQFDPYGTIGHTDARRYYITQDSDMMSIGSPELISLGQTNVGSPKPLSDFIEWGINNYPAEKYCLVLYDHGSGWSGGIYDWTLSEGVAGEDYLTLAEMTGGIDNGLAFTEVDKFDMVFMHMCIMGMVEVAHAFAPYARFQVSSADLAWATGTNYTKILGPLASNPHMGPQKFGEVIVDDYMNNCKTIMEGYILEPYCFSVIDLARIQDITSACKGLLGAAMEDASGWWIDFCLASSVSEMYFTYYGYGDYTSYIDLGDFAEILAFIAGDEGVADNAAALKTAVEDAVVYSRSNEKLPNSTGMGIYMPHEFYYYSTEDLGEYTRLAFCEETGWSVLSPAMITLLETAGSEIDIYDLEVSGGPIENDVPVTCAAEMDALFPTEVGLLVTLMEPYEYYPSERQVMARIPMENVITLPGGREISIWDREDNQLSKDWDGIYVALSNGTASLPISVTEYYDPDNDANYAHCDVEIDAGSGVYYDYATLLFDADTGVLLECIVFDWDLYEYVPYILQPDDTVIPGITTIDLNGYYGFYNYSGEDGLVVSGGTSLGNSQIPDGDYYIGFYALGRNGDYTFTYEQLTVQR
ncbi:MAG: clostripain-related cysteine peptidase [Planctomycetota bacterium]|jgi:hypothetical protein